MEIRLDETTGNSVFNSIIEKDLKTYDLNSQQVTFDEIKLAISISESNESKFKIGRSLLMILYHLMFLMLTPFLALPIIFVLEGFNFHLIYNINFFQNSMYFYIQIMMSSMIVASYYFYYHWWQDCNKDTIELECFLL